MADDITQRPYATSVTWRNDSGGSWQQWHDDEDPMPTEWDDRPPDEVVHVYASAQVDAMQAALRARVDELEAEVQRRGADAERWRWLAPRLVEADLAPDGNGPAVLLFAWPSDAAISGDLDASIDAARKAERKEG